MVYLNNFNRNEMNYIRLFNYNFHYFFIFNIFLLAIGIKDATVNAEGVNIV